MTPVTTWMILGKSPNLSGTRFPHLVSEDNNKTISQDHYEGQMSY